MRCDTELFRSSVFVTGEGSSGVFAGASRYGRRLSAGASSKGPKGAGCAVPWHRLGRWPRSEWQEFGVGKRQQRHPSPLRPARVQRSLARHERQRRVDLETPHSAASRLLAKEKVPGSNPGMGSSCLYEPRPICWTYAEACERCAGGGISGPCLGHSAASRVLTGPDPRAAGGSS